MLASQVKQRVATKGLAPWQVERATQLLCSDTAADRSVAMIAEACGLSRSHFGRAFKSSTGLSPHQWLLRYRAWRAAELLERTGDSICAIALHCGFADQSHLTRVFRAIMGLSPAEWRRRRRSDAVLNGIEFGRPAASLLSN